MFVLPHIVLGKELPGLLEDLSVAGTSRRRLYCLPAGAPVKTLGQLLHLQIELAIVKALDAVCEVKREVQHSTTSRSRSASSRSSSRSMVLKRVEAIVADIDKVREVVKRAHLEHKFDSEARRLAVYLTQKYANVL
jgi:hypothetical protein